MHTWLSCPAHIRLSDSCLCMGPPWLLFLEQNVPIMIDVSVSMKYVPIVSISPFVVLFYLLLLCLLPPSFLSSALEEP